ncbi:hypothetical protein PTTG_27405, partial [Puccinia triticina 1-1 BBBD Race 1]
AEGREPSEALGWGINPHAGPPPLIFFSKLAALTASTFLDATLATDVETIHLDPLGYPNSAIRSTNPSAVITMHHCFIQTGEYLSPCKCIAPVSPPPSPWQPAQLCPLTKSRFSHSYSASTSSTFPTCGLHQTPTAKHSLPRRPHLQTRDSLTFYDPAPAGPLNCSKSTAGCRPETPSCSSRSTCWAWWSSAPR